MPIINKLHLYGCPLYYMSIWVHYRYTVAERAVLRLALRHAVLLAGGEPDLRARARHVHAAAEEDAVVQLQAQQTLAPVPALHGAGGVAEP